MRWLGLVLLAVGLSSASPSASAQRAKDACVIKRGDETAGVCYETNYKCANMYRTYKNQPCQRTGAYRCDTNQGTFFYYPPFSGYMRDNRNTYVRYNPTTVCNSLKTKLTQRKKKSKTKDACMIWRGDETVGLCYESYMPCAKNYRTYKNKPCSRNGAYRCDTQKGSFFIYSPATGSVRVGNSYKKYSGYSSCQEFKKTMNTSKKRKRSY